MIRLIFGIILSALFVVACTKEATRTEPLAFAKADTITKEDTISWTGIYSGTVPNPKSVGLEMKLTLNPSNTYSLNVIHLQKDPKDNIEEEFTGEINWEDDSTTIVLKELDSISNKFRIKKDIVEYLNPDATPNTSDLAEFYVLKKQ